MYTTTIFLYTHSCVYMFICWLYCHYIVKMSTPSHFSNLCSVPQFSTCMYTFEMAVCVSEQANGAHNVCVRVHSNWLPWSFWWCTHTCECLSLCECVLGPVHVSVSIMCMYVYKYFMLGIETICDCEREKECVHDVRVCVYDYDSVQIMYKSPCQIELSTNVMDDEFVINLNEKYFKHTHTIRFENVQIELLEHWYLVKLSGLSVNES